MKTRCEKVLIVVTGGVGEVDGMVEIVLVVASVVRRDIDEASVDPRNASGTEIHVVEFHGTRGSDGERFIVDGCRTIP